MGFDVRASPPPLCLWPLPLAVWGPPLDLIWIKDGADGAQ
jgi:hypothetical protein